jgi:hypothetical protein
MSDPLPQVFSLDVDVWVRVETGFVDRFFLTVVRISHLPLFKTALSTSEE